MKQSSTTCRQSREKTWTWCSTTSMVPANRINRIARVRIFTRAMVKDQTIKTCRGTEYQPERGAIGVLSRTWEEECSQPVWAPRTNIQTSKTIFIEYTLPLHKISPTINIRLIQFLPLIYRLAEDALSSTEYLSCPIVFWCTWRDSSKALTSGFLMTLPKNIFSKMS